MLVQPLPFPAFAKSPLIITVTGPGSIDFATDPRLRGFNPANNTIEMIGAGGSGGIYTGNGNGCKAGGGGQYAKIVNYNPASGAINFQIGVGGGTRGTAAAPGTGDSWFESSTGTLYAQAGESAVDGVTGGNTHGGDAAAVGTSTVANGGQGGGAGIWSQGSGSGGGAGGPHGAGSNGGSLPGGAGTNAGGDGDAHNVAGAAGSATNGNPGATENYWGTGYGPGSGGSAGGGSGGSTPYNGGNGGNYGGGGGGAGANTGGTRGVGGQGILVISWVH